MHDDAVPALDATGTKEWETRHDDDPPSPPKIIGHEQDEPEYVVD